MPLHFDWTLVVNFILWVGGLLAWSYKAWFQKWLDRGQTAAHANTENADSMASLTLQGKTNSEVSVQLLNKVMAQNDQLVAYNEKLEHKLERVDAQLSDLTDKFNDLKESTDREKEQLSLQLTIQHDRVKALEEFIAVVKKQWMTYTNDPFPDLPGEKQ